MIERLGLHLVPDIEGIFNSSGLLEHLSFFRLLYSKVIEFQNKKGWKHDKKNINHNKSIIFHQQTRMHKASRWHLANRLPFITNHIVSLDRAQRNIIETSEHIDLLRLVY